MARGDLEEGVRRLTAVQGGAIHRRQVAQLGGDRWWIQRQVARGVLERRDRGVLALAGAPATHERRRWEAVLAGGPAAVLSHRCAAGLHGLEGFGGGRPEITVPWPAHPRLAGVVVHQLGDVEPEDRTVRSGLPVTTVARTIGDLASVCSVTRVLRALDDALTRDRVDLDDLASVAHRLVRPRKPGARCLAKVAAARLTDAPPPESELERLVEDLLMRAGLPRPRRQHQTPGGRVDFAYPDRRLAIEADGRRWHARADRMLDDRRRDRNNSAAGWITIRCMWEDVVKTPDRLVGELRDVWTAAGATEAERGGIDPVLPRPAA
ncbi:MAG: DUF559 domain-containing protein [Actinomycetota bacterium]